MPVSVAVVDYNLGNVESVINAFGVVGYEAFLSSRAEDFTLASHIVLPGVGAFAEGMENLRLSNLIGTLEEEVIVKKKPFLGICLGMQLVCRKSYENGMHEGLGWIPAAVKKLGEDMKNLALPHIGWNTVSIRKKAPLFSNLPDEPTFYFVHSYHCFCDDPALVTSECFYGQNFTASFQKGNIFGTQFHPEKSQLSGLALLKNFIEYSHGGE